MAVLLIGIYDEGKSAQSDKKHTVTHNKRTTGFSHALSCMVDYGISIMSSFLTEKKKKKSLDFVSLKSHLWKT